MSAGQNYSLGTGPTIGRANLDGSGASPRYITASVPGPGVTATPATVGDAFVDGQVVADRVTGVTVNAPETLGVSIKNGATPTDSTVNALSAQHD